MYGMMMPDQHVTAPGTKRMGFAVSLSSSFGCWFRVIRKSCIAQVLFGDSDSRFVVVG